jgi:predicted CXXCH cytochrome family protein
MTVRKLALLLGAGALWLFVAALPVFADGGPHQMAVNNGTGTGGLTADTCAGCHRAHTASAEGLLNNDLPELCLDCHNGTKATTDVLHGIQYDPTSASGAVLGALRGGGFTTARIDSADPARLSYLSGTNVRNIGHVQPLAAGQAVTSTHGGTGGILSASWGDGTVWGNSGTNPVGATVALNCASCHNPHGNGQYRILQTKPSVTASSGAFALTNAGGVEVQDTAYTGVRNYTIRPSSNGLASGVVAGTSGDYWRYHWDPTGAVDWTLTSAGADPMNSPWNSLTASYINGSGTHYVVAYPVNTGEIAAYNTQLAADGITDPVTGNASISTLDNKGGLMTAWCIQCHTRYNGNWSVQGDPGSQSLGVASLYDNSGGDSRFMYKHGTTRIGCEQCHVSHGSNAAMTGSNSFAYVDPNGDVPPTVGVSGDSRLLKADNRGTCQLCHDPTGTITAGTYIGPLPTPGN